MATPMDSGIRGKITSDDQTLTNGGGAQTKYFVLDPAKPVTVQVTGGGDTYTLSTTNNYNADLEAAAVNWVQRESGTDDRCFYLESGLTGVKVVATPTTADVDVTVTQVV